MHDIPKVDDPLLRAILEMREYLDEMIDHEKRHIGDWVEENARAAGLAATAEVGGPRRDGASAHAAAWGETRADGGDRAVRPAPVDPRGGVASPAADRRGPGHDVDADDPRKRLDALARRLDGRIGRPQGPAADGS